MEGNGYGRSLGKSGTLARNMRMDVRGNVTMSPIILCALLKDNKNKEIKLSKRKNPVSV